MAGKLSTLAKEHKAGREARYALQGDTTKGSDIKHNLEAENAGSK
jgi:hypothetical protein